MAKSITALLDCKTVAELIQTLGKSEADFKEYVFANADIYQDAAAAGRNLLVVRLVRVMALNATRKEFTHLEIGDVSGEITSADIALDNDVDFERLSQELLTHCHENTFPAVQACIAPMRVIANSLKDFHVMRSLGLPSNETRLTMLYFLAADTFNHITPQEALNMRKHTAFWFLQPEAVKKAITKKTNLQDYIPVIKNFKQLHEGLTYMKRESAETDIDIREKMKERLESAIHAKMKELLASVDSIEDLKYAFVHIDMKSCKAAIIRIMFNDYVFVDHANLSRNPFSDLSSTTTKILNALDVNASVFFLVNASARKINELGSVLLTEIFACFSVAELIAVTKSEAHAQRLLGMMNHNEVDAEKTAKFKVEIDEIAKKCNGVLENLREERNIPTNEANFKAMVWELAKHDKYSAKQIMDAITAHYQTTQSSSSARSSLFRSIFGSPATPSQPPAELKSSSAASAAAAEASLTSLVKKLAPKK